MMNHFPPVNPAGNGFDAETSKIGLQVFSGPDLVHDASVSEDGALPQSLIDSFAAATGWELAVVGDQVKIVDMSDTWPAKTPTAHRGKCDQFAEELSRLVFAKTAASAKAK